MAPSRPGQCARVSTGPFAGRELRVMVLRVLREEGGREGERGRKVLTGGGGVAWQVLLATCAATCPEDGVPRALLQYIQATCLPDGMQPPSWRGFRQLDSK